MLSSSSKALNSVDVCSHALIVRGPSAEAFQTSCHPVAQLKCCSSCLVTCTPSISFPWLYGFCCQTPYYPPPPSPHSQTSTLNFTNISSPAKLPGMPAFFLLVSSSESLILGPRQRATAVALHGALIIRLGFWVKHTITMIRKPQNSIGNYIFTIQKGWKTVTGNRRTRELMQNMVRRAAGKISTTHPTARSKKCRGP